MYPNYCQRSNRRNLAERDLVHNIAEHGLNMLGASIKKYMSNPVLTCSPDESVYSLMDKFLGLRIRHILVKDGENVVGLLSSGDVMKAALRAKDLDLAQANAKLSWEYYEEWKYKPQS